MNARTQIVCAWLGILCPLIFFAGLYPLAGFFPPPHPDAGAAEIAVIYQQHTVAIRLGALVIMMSSAFYIPYTAVIAAQMRRIEHRLTPVLTYTQIGAGIGVVNLFFLPALFWTAAAFRPYRPAEVTQALNDLGWLTLLMPFMLAAAQNVALGVAILQDKSRDPVFPRWLGYFNFWITMLLAPGAFITFFKSGILAWNGLLGFYVPVVCYGPWFFVVSWQVIKAAKRQAAELG